MITVCYKKLNCIKKRNLKLIFFFSGEVQLPDSVDPGRKNMDALKINELEIETGRQVI